MRRVFALLCAFVFLAGCAFCEELVQPEEITETPVEPDKVIEEDLTGETPDEVSAELSEPPLEEESPEEPIEEPVEELVEEPIEEPIEEPSIEETSESVEETPTPTEQLSSEPTPPPIEVIEAVEEFEEPEEEAFEVASDLVEFEEDDWGEVTIAFKREVYISFLREPKYLGDTVTLVASLVNFRENDHYTIFWQYSEDGQNWISIDGEDERTYTFILDAINCHYVYRVLIELEGE